MFERKYEVVDEISVGDNKYELRKMGSGKNQIYVYSNMQKSWSPYAKADVEEKWNSIKKFR